VHFKVKIRQESTSTTANVGRLRTIHSLDAIFSDLRENVLQKLADFDARSVLYEPLTRSQSYDFVVNNYNG
jgi:hypothetical protein